jgi:hypothetical protein
LWEELETIDAFWKKRAKTPLEKSQQKLLWEKASKNSQNQSKYLNYILSNANTASKENNTRYITIYFDLSRSMA